MEEASNRTPSAASSDVPAVAMGEPIGSKAPMPAVGVPIQKVMDIWWWEDYAHNHADDPCSEDEAMLMPLSEEPATLSCTVGRRLDDDKWKWEVRSSGSITEENQRALDLLDLW